MRNASLLAAFVAATLIGSSAQAEIVFTGGVADLTFYYESDADRWDVVLQRKGAGGTGTQGTGLDNVYDGFTGIVGQSEFNRTFSTSLTTNLSTDQFVTVGSTKYAVSRASGSPFFNAGSSSFPNSPDLGIRTRLRENEVALGNPEGNAAADQFDSFNLILDLDNSTFNGNALAGNANFSLLGWNAFDAPDVMIDTAASSLTANFSNWGHVHRNFGFSQSGEYDLAFQIQGVGGTYGGSATTHNFNLGFNVTAVPEPATTGLLAAGLGCVALGRRFRRKKSISEPAERDALAAVS